MGRKREGSHGTWKIAYADFMTAMMAFFLVMWLLSGLNDAEIAGVSEYFRTPLQVAMTGGDQNTASDSAIPGGGDDPRHTDGAIQRMTPQARNRGRDNVKLSQIASELKSDIQDNSELRPLENQIEVRVVPDGLRIEIFDDKNRPMFELGSSVLQEQVAVLIDHVVPRLNEIDNPLLITGHTDDLRYAAGQTGYSNWELSTDRANASRRELVAAGMPNDKLARVVGLAASDLLHPDDPRAPQNRRITITVLTHEAEERLLGKQTPTVHPDSKLETEKQENPPPAPQTP